jgi:hypothetical protein
LRIAIALSLLLVVAILGGLLLLPRLIAWDDYRAELTEQAEALTGQSVEIRGRIDLELLPRPALTLTQATLSGGVGRPTERALEVDRLDLRLKLLPLLAGRFEVDQIRLVGPVLQVARPKDAGSVVLGLAGGGIVLPLAADGPRRLSVVDGRAVVAGAVPEHVVEAINLELVAAGPAGPYEVDGKFTLAAQPFEFNAKLGQLAPDAWSTLQLEVSALDGDDPARLSFRGLGWSDPSALRLRGDLVLRGGDARAGLLALDAALGQRLPPLPGWLGAGFRLAGHLELADRIAQLDQLHLALGEVEAGGALRLALGAPPTVDLRLDFARLRAPDSISLPESDDLALLAGLAMEVAGQIDVSIGELAWRGGLIQRVRTTLVLDGSGGLRVEQSRATLPGQTTLGFTGALAGGPSEAALEGQLTLVTSDLRHLLAWLELEPAEVPEGRLRTLSLASGLKVSDRSLRFIDGELRVDASRLAGGLALSLGTRRQIAGALTLDRLDLDAYWPGGRVRQLVERTLAPFGQLDVALEARIERFTWHGLRLQDVFLDARSVAGRLSVSQLSLHDPAGNHGRLTGELEVAGGAFDLSAELDSARPAQLLRTFGIKPPRMLARLTPIRLEGTLRGDRAAAQLQLSLRHAEARLTLAGPLDWAGAEPGYDLTLEAGHPDYPALLDRIGIPRTTAAEHAAAFSMTGRLQGDLSTTTTLVGTARLGDMSLTGRAGWQHQLARPKLMLQVSAGEPDAAALADLLALAGLRVEPSLLARPRVAGWSEQPLELRWLGAFDAELELSGKGGLAGIGFELRAQLEQGRLTIERLAAALWGGQVEVQSSFDTWRPLPFMALALDLRRIDPAALATWLDLPPVVEGPVDLYSEATAAGGNLRDLIGSLIGDLRIALPDGRLWAGEELAELRATQGIDDAGQSAVPRANGSPAGPVAPGDASVMAIDNLSGRFALERGIATTAALGFELEGTPARLAGSIDLLLWVADLRLTVGAFDGTDGAALQLIGPLDRPQVRLLTPAPPPHP